MKIKKMIGRSIIILVVLLIMISLVNGQDEEVVIVEGKMEIEAEVEVSESQELVPTNLDVFLIDRVHGSQIRLNDSIMYLKGEMKIAEDIFTYNNTFVDGDLYKITVMIELRDTE